jgi:tetratricopeptide (TPR) repeat protein
VAAKEKTTEGSKPAAPAAETVTVVVQNSTETYTETLPIGPSATETTDATLSTDAKEKAPKDTGAQASEVITSEGAEAAATVEATNAGTELEETKPVAAIRGREPAKPEANAMEPEPALDPAPDSLADQLLEAEPAVLDIPQQVAYEEYLKDTNDPMHAFDSEDADEAELPGSPEPVATINPSGDLQIEMDTKNAHVWNELGNVYFNSSAYDDAIVAYSKAIELDRWFAWPYSNLALAYVQKRRFVEAILLYQRSIELFGSDKDKAISWNRLGNVYRRLNDYENAIASYQRADALDPDNSTLSLQSRFSLLGNYAIEQKPSYVS